MVTFSYGQAIRALLVDSDRLHVPALSRGPAGRRTCRGARLAANV